MKSIGFEGVVREGKGKKIAAQIRREGKVPCILYGSGKEVTFLANEISFNKLINTPEVYLIDLSIDGKKVQAILKEVQYHPVTDRVIHADFLEVSADKAVTVKIPVKFVGTAAGVREGGRLLTTLRKLKVKAKPANLPDGVEVNIESLKIGDKIKVGDLVERSYEVLDLASSVIVAVRNTRAAIKGDDDVEADDEAEEGAEEGAPAAEATTEA